MSTKQPKYIKFRGATYRLARGPVPVELKPEDWGLSKEASALVIELWNKFVLPDDDFMDDYADASEAASALLQKAKGERLDLFADDYENMFHVLEDLLWKREGSPEYFSEAPWGRGY